jgi:carbon-monoxide dehydrogenase large subunit
MSETIDAGIGQPVRRKEDNRLLTGQGRFSDDFTLPSQTHAVMVRSLHPHARIRGIDTVGARQMPGVLGVFTGVDCEADGLGEIPHSPLPKTRFDLKLHGPGGSDVFIGHHTLLPADKTRYVGEALVMVVAETKAEAADAAERVEIDFEALPAVTKTAAAALSGAPGVWDETQGNILVETFFGDEAATEEAFARADHVVRRTFDIARVTGVPMEPRSALGVHDRASGRTTLYAGSGGAVRQKAEIATVLNEDPANVRVVSMDVGGNFGTRNRLYVEFGLVVWAARKLGRPVKFTCERSDSFVSDYQGRDLVTEVELALDRDGTFLALRAANLSNVGARCVSLSPLSKGSGIVTGSYRIPAAWLRSRAVFSHTPPTNAYRSSGRPEVIFAIERLIDSAANELGFDPIELRRRNLVASDEMPYANAVGMTYDSGEYRRSLDMAMRLADWDGMEERRRDAESRGRLLGRGLAHYVESSIGTPVEQAEIHVAPDAERIDVIIGTQPSGQGHETSFAQVAAQWLGVPVDRVHIVLGDTDIVKVGGGSHSGRSMRMAGTVIVKAADALIAKGRRIAAHTLEAAETDIEFAGGRFVVAGTDRALTIFEVARAETPDGSEPGLSAVEDNEMHTPVFPNGCHVCEVEVDPETGAVDIVRYAAVDDVGRAINPLIVDGQTHGGIVQGVGEAMWEQCVFDPESGQPLAGSFMDYGMPRADHFPSFATALNEVPSPTNPLGVKAGGEGGTTPAPGVIVNAVVDALRTLGVDDLSMPLTPHSVWRAIRAAQGKKAA